MQAHRFAIGQTVRLGRKFGFSPKSAELYTVTALLPEQGGELRYRIRADAENHDRAVTEADLEEIPTAAG